MIDIDTNNPNNTVDLWKYLTSSDMKNLAKFKFESLSLIMGENH